MNAPEKRKPGRPKGSKNKRKGLSAANVRQICDYHKFNPAEKLIAIANNEDTDTDGNSINWPLAFQARATEKLFDAIHNKKSLPGVDDGEGAEKQFEIVFIESGEHFQLPGESSTEGAAGVLQSSPVQRPSLSPPDGENGLCAELVDTQGADLRET